MNGEIISAGTLAAGSVLRTDVAVIGSGAGGATLAARVAEAGREVTILEAGPAVKTEEFSANPHEMAVKLYADSALAATVGFPAIPVYYGRCLGGSTTINSGTCFRTPDKVFEKWRRAGLAGFSDEALDGWYREIERDLHIAAPPLSLIGRNAEILHEVRTALGLSGGVIKRNASGCRASGLCCFGCPTGGKQSMLVSAIPRAVRAGARVLADCRVDRIVRKGGRVVALEATVQSNGDPDRAARPLRPLRIEAREFVLCGGAMMSPGLLWRSGIRPGALGRHLTLHPALKVAAIMAEEVRPVDGVPQSYFIDEWHDDGFLIETIAVPPTIEALSLPFAGPRHAALMERAEHMLSWGAMISDSSEGRIRFLPGKDLPTYSLNQRDARVAKAAMLRLAWLAFEAGAESVLTTTYGASEFRSVDELRRFARKPIKPSDLDLTAFHPLGTCRMGIDPARSVVDRDHRVHGLDNLRVVDGSVFPSSLSVNPQWTIMAFALRAADRLLGR